MGFGYKSDQGTLVRWPLALLTLMLVVAGSVTIYTSFIPTVEARIIENVEVHARKTPLSLGDVATISSGTSAFKLEVTPKTKESGGLAEEAAELGYQERVTAIKKALQAVEKEKGIVEIGETVEVFRALRDFEVPGSDTEAEAVALADLADVSLSKQKIGQASVLVRKKSEIERIFQALDGLKAELEILALSRIENEIQVQLPVVLTVSFPESVKIPHIGIYLSGGFVAAALWFVVLTAIMLYYLFFQERAVNFLIETENELKKVHWPTLPEAKRAVIIVIGTIIFFGVYIIFADALLQWLFGLLDILPSV